jgi:thioester reductase-like protein
MSYRQLTDTSPKDWQGASAPESRLFDAAVAVASGYSESKWVAESILAEAAQKTALKPVVVRVGQLSGGPSGCWTTRDWLPAIVKSAEALGCLPRARGVSGTLCVLTRKVLKSATL